MQLILSNVLMIPFCLLSRFFPFLRTDLVAILPFGCFLGFFGASNSTSACFPWYIASSRPTKYKYRSYRNANAHPTYTNPIQFHQANVSL
jgi:hypothetical protein